MAEVDLKEIYHAIGTIGAKIDGLGERVTESDRRNDERDRHASDKMQKLYDTLNEVSVRQISLDNRLTAMEKDSNNTVIEVKEWRSVVDSKLAEVIKESAGNAVAVASWKPTVDWVSTLRQRWIGMCAAGIVFLFMFGAAFDTFKANFLRLFTQLG